MGEKPRFLIKQKRGFFRPPPQKTGAAPKKPAPRPRARRICPLRPARRAPPPPGGFGPVCPRAAPPAPPPGNRPPGAPAPAAGPLCPHRRRPVFRRAAVRPRPPSPGGKPPPRPAPGAPPPKARRRPARAQKKARRPRRGPAAPAPRPVPQGGSNSRARFGGDRGPLSREIPRNSGPGVSPQKSKNARKNPAKKRKAAAHADRCLKWLDKLPHHAEVVFFRIEYGQYADDLLRFINAVEDQIILMQDVAKVKATQNAVFR